VGATFDFLRRDAAAGCYHVENPLGLDVRLFANAEVHFEKSAFQQLFDFLDVSRAVSDLREAEAAGRVSFFGDAPAGIDKVVLTPDFHKGSLVPVGTVARAQHFCIPQAIGNDICCGMRLLVTDLPAEALDPYWPEIQKRLRAIFFAGERNIPMSPRQREAVLRDGLPGLLRTAGDNEKTGIWTRFDPVAERENLSRAHDEGHFETRRLFGFESFIEASGRVDGRDPQIGCVGGGNHFVELQRIDALFDGHAARAWGMSKGCLAIMVHSGSVGLGHAIGGHFMGRAHEIFPTIVKAPAGGFYPLPTSGPRAEEGLFYLDGMGNAANFAFANRLFLGLMAVRAIEEASGRTLSTKLVYDAPHNLVFRTGDSMLHRKGATPAYGPSGDDYHGRPCLIPGCFAAGTRILMANGHYESIENIHPGDRVIDGAGNPAAVRNILRRGRRDVWRYRNNNWFADTVATPDHLHFVGDFSSTPNAQSVAGRFKPDGRRSYSFTRTAVLDRRTKSGESKYAWRRLDELPKRCYSYVLLMPRRINFVGMKRTFVEYREGWALTPSYDLGYVLGLFVADGTTYYKPADGGQVTWALALDQDEMAAKLSAALMSIFAVKTKLYRTKNVLLVVVHNVRLARLFLDFGKKRTKALPGHFWCKQRAYTRGVYDGLYDGDGHFNAGSKKITNTSVACIEQFMIIHHLLFGYLPSISVRPPSAGGLAERGCDVKRCGPSYRATSLGKPPLSRLYQLIEMRRVDRKKRSALVYDLELDGPEPSFIANNAIVHNSMGAASYVLAGQGREDALESACHGAGRALSRGKATHVDRDVYEREIGKLRVVGPIDPRSPRIARRRDIVEAYEKRLMEEAPYAYKAVEPVVDSVEDAQIARKVARLMPLCTVKG